MSRIVQRFQHGRATCTVRYSSDWQEYTVLLSVDGVDQPEADYCTDDKTDALQTAQAMAEQAHKTAEQNTRQA